MSAATQRKRQRKSTIFLSLFAGITEPKITKGEPVGEKWLMTKYNNTRDKIEITFEYYEENGKKELNPMINNHDGSVFNMPGGIKIMTRSGDHFRIPMFKTSTKIVFIDTVSNFEQFCALCIPTGYVAMDELTPETPFSEFWAEPFKIIKNQEKYDQIVPKNITIKKEILRKTETQFIEFLSTEIEKAQSRIIKHLS